MNPEGRILPDSPRPGRPDISPFLDDSEERRCYDRALKLLELCYRPGVFGRNKDYVVLHTSESRKKKISKIGKTTIWAMVYYYYFIDKKLIRKNLKGWIEGIKLKLGPECVPDRTSVHKSIKMLEELQIHRKRSEDVVGNEEVYKNYVKWNKRYMILRHFWENCTDVGFETQYRLDYKVKR